jgi:bifunctional DNA-binding transcriptional regulator/antitoxin component of YhaV-PrlF toxin-antitoxin module
MKASDNKPLVNQTYLLEKYPGKGGWTYAAIPEVLQDKKAHFGWVKVKGSIDGYELKNYRLMPMGNGRLFLPVKAEIRKKLGKSAGDRVHIILYPDHDPLEIPRDFLSCLEDEPAAYKNFMNLNESEQKAYVDWIYSSKKTESRVERIVKSIEKITKGRRLSEKEN